MNRGFRITPADQAFDFSFARSTLPASDWWNDRWFDNDWKFGGRPSARQFAARVAGSGPLPSSSASHGSVAKPKKVLDGLNTSVIAGARIAWVKLPRTAM